MKTRLLVLATILSLCSQVVPAQAATLKLTVSTYLTVTFDSSIKYAGKDCTKIKFNYKGKAGLSYPAQVEFIGIYTPGGDEVALQEIKIGDTYGLGQGGDPVNGAKLLEICKTSTTQLADPDCDPEFEAEFGDECEYEETIAVKPGKYYVQASVVQIRPSYLSKESKKVNITIGK
jgi:hypothetical protein